MVVEIPKGCVVVDGSWFDVCASTNAKLEISKSVKGNPIVQDIKDGLLRYAFRQTISDINAVWQHY